MNDHLVRYFEDYVPGVTFECGTVSMDEAAIVAFAKEYDPQPFHTDPAAAAMSQYGGLIASGWHTLAVTMRPLVEKYLSADSSLGSPGVDEVRWPAPVRPGDTLHIRATVTSARRSQSKPDRGIIQTHIEVTNQHATPVLHLTITNFILTHPT